ncbi:hypothetical protein MPH_08267 [Macrophomina phaseolina MS6]|uniref:Uncharacterized protein n=1 Tax=Macrophomina phaseolina (strain MS6) TaxID=1126212 RepID=K2QXH4_MACPH|nr:hypothetical protein MPH_08267 [Macrophomina phaseolina MS6]
MISSLVRRIYLRLDDYLKTNMGSVASRPCCRYTARAHSDDVANCNALCFGSLILELQKIGLGPERKKAADIDKSVCSLTDSIRNMKVRSLADNRKLYGAAMEDHSVCSSHEFLLDPQAYALANVSPVLHAHQVHMILKQKELYDITTEMQIQARFSVKHIKTVSSVRSNPKPVRSIF